MALTVALRWHCGGTDGGLTRIFFLKILPKKNCGVLELAVIFCDVFLFFADGTPDSSQRAADSAPACVRWCVMCERVRWPERKVVELTQLRELTQLTLSTQINNV